MNSFVHVAEQGSYTGAAHKLNKTKALMSTHVSQLETLLSVRLINRSTRALQLTDAGRAYYEQARRVLDDIQTLEAQLRQEHRALAGRLRISAPATFGERVVLPFIAEFMRDYPDLLIEVELNDRYVDITAEGFDLAIRIGALQDSSLVAKPLGHTHMVLCASPALLQEHGHLETPAQLRDLPGIVDTNARSAGLWPCFRDGQEYSLRIKPVAFVNSATASARLAAAGIGIACCPEFAVRSLLASGELIQLLPDYSMESASIHAVYHYRKHLSARVATFNDALAAYLQQDNG